MTLTDESHERSDSSTATLLSIRGLRKSFGAIRAVKDVSFDIEAGQVLGLVGENGAGKSTVVAMLSGALSPDAGAITIDGVPHESFSPTEARGLGVDAIRQDPALVGTISVAENLALGREPGRFGWFSTREAHRTARAWLGAIGADLDTRAVVDDISPAQRQQVEIAKAIGGGARVALFDEPTAALGPSEVESLFDLIGRLAASGTAVIYVSHRLEEIFRVCDRVVVMRDGALVADRSITELDEEGLVELMVGREVGVVERTGVPAAVDGGLSLVGVGHRGRLHDISLDFDRGVVHGLFGIVGSGRSRLAGVIAGLYRPTSGSMSLDGSPYAPRAVRHAIRAGVVLVPEDRKHQGTLSHLSVATNIVIRDLTKVHRFGWLTHRSERDHAAPLIEELDIRPRTSSATVGSLSGGNQQKVMIGRALFDRANVLVFDEPTQGVDVGAKFDIHQLIRDLAASGVAVIVVSSDLRELLAISDRVSVLVRGSVAATYEGQLDGSQILAAAVGTGQPS